MTNKEFLKHEFSILAWSASVQHNKTYKDNCKKKEKDEFKCNLLEFVKLLLATYSKIEINEERHCENILKITNEAERIGRNILFEGKFKIGNSQKLFNLLLKYYWCSGWIKRPPHCPIDSIVLKNAKLYNIQWTKIKDIKDYKIVIDKIKKKIGEEKLADWELMTYKRKDSLTSTKI